MNHPRKPAERSPDAFTCRWRSKLQPTRACRF